MVKVRFLVKHRQNIKGDEAAVTDAVAEALLRQPAFRRKHKGSQLPSETMTPVAW